MEPIEEGLLLVLFVGQWILIMYTLRRTFLGQGQARSKTVETYRNAPATTQRPSLRHRLAHHIGWNRVHIVDGGDGWMWLQCNGCDSRRRYERYRLPRVRYEIDWTDYNAPTHRGEE